MKKLLCVILTICMCTGLLPFSVAAAECVHHTTHTADCGYAEAIAGRECAHEHDDSCYKMVDHCQHQHDADCGYQKAVEESPCTHICGLECAEGCIHGIHDAACGFAEAQAEIPCTHTCDASCLEKVLDCKHAHDAQCGYQEEIPASPCMYQCTECQAVDSNDATEETEPVVAAEGNTAAAETNKLPTPIVHWLTEETEVQDGDYTYQFPAGTAYFENIPQEIMPNYEVITTYQNGEVFEEYQDGFGGEAVGIQKLHIGYYTKNEMPSGRYTTKVRFLGDEGETYTDGDFSTPVSYDYVYPGAYGEPTDLKWENGKMVFTYPEDADETSNVFIQFGKFENGELGTHRSRLGRLSEGQDRFLERFRELVNREGPGEYKYNVRIISEDILQKYHSPWSAWSESYFVTDADGDTLGKLDKITNDAALSNEEKIEAVQALAKEESFKDQLASDQAGNGVAGKLEALEEKMNLTTAVKSSVSDIAANEVKIIGAAFNTDGEAAATLKIDKLENEKQLEETYKSVLQVDLNLEKVQKDKNGKLAVPIRITMPVPGEYDPKKLVILHYINSTDKTEIIYPHIYKDASGKNMVTFVLHSLSPVVFCEKVEEEQQQTALTDAMVTLSQEEVIYNGKVQQPKAVVVNNGKTLEQGQDYTMTLPTDMQNAGVKTIVITGIGDYSGTVEKAFIIKKATPTGSPAYTAIRSAGKTLKDAALTTEGSTFDVTGTVSWEKAADTAVERNTAYKWIFTPTDDTNYTSLEGDIVLWKRSSSGGGGSSSSHTSVTNKKDSTELKLRDEILSAKRAEELVKEARKNDSEKIILEASKNKVTLPAGLADDIAEKTDAALVIKTENGTITLPNKTLGNLESEGDFTVTLTKTKVIFSDEEGKLYDVRGAEISVPYQETSRAENVAVKITKHDGTVQILENVYTEKEQVVFLVDGSVTYEILEDDAAPETEEPSDKEKGKQYADVAETDWFYEAVSYVADKGIMTGVDEQSFAPKLPVTRGMLTTILWRLEDRPSAAVAPFADVAGDSYYADAIAWAAQNGIISGYDKNTFGAEDAVTREQLASILWRYAKDKGYDVSVGENTNILSYKDADEISGYAIPAMQWACGAGILNGYENGTLASKDTAERAHIAQMLMQFMENM